MKKLIAFFLKHKPNESPKDFNFRAGNFASLTGLFINILLFASKLLVGLLASSISIIADAINNLSDSFSSCIAVASFHISKKPADKNHPFGHARVEYLFSSVVAIVIVFLGVQLLYQSALKIKNPSQPNFDWISVVVLTFSILAKLFLSVFYMTIAKKINSPLLEATSADSKADVLSTSIILISIPIYYFTNFSVDSYLGVLVSIFIIKSGFDILKETIDRILGAAPCPNEVKNIKNFIMSYESIEGVHDIIIHDYGPAHRFVSAHAEVDAKADILESHTIIDQIEQDAVEKLHIQLILHMDPVILDDPEVNDAQEKIAQALAGLNLNLDFHDFRMIRSYRSINVLFDVDVPQTCTLSDTELSKKIIAEIKKIESTFNPLITFDRNYIRSSTFGKDLK
ncbi:MAG: cation diffusion facilitator family transporter [Treponemataceae bacterium]